MSHIGEHHVGDSGVQDFCIWYVGDLAQDDSTRLWLPSACKLL